MREIKVLIIDDEDDVREVVAVTLSRVGGMKVIEANCGKDGLDKALQEGPDVILLDVMMPQMDGPSTLAALRQNTSTQNIPVVFLTAKAMLSEIENLKKMGAIGVLTKPFQIRTLSQQLRDLLEQEG
jgi:CheY-like chemotaxis protein